MDAERFGSAEWDPLRDIVQPGQTVVLKPNLVTHFNHGSARGLVDTDSLVTHGSVVRAVADYAAKALGTDGRLIICDCPLQGTDWDSVVRLTGLDSVVAYLQTAHPTLQIDLVDYRLGTATVRRGRIVERHVDETRRCAYDEVDLGASSLLAAFAREGGSFGVTQYGFKRMQAAHTGEVNKYLIPRDVLEADAFINLPKLKTHMKTGVTGALKNLVGINGHKDYLPHFRLGSPRTGGDEYPDGNWWWDLTWNLTHREWELDGGRLKSLLAFAARACRRASPFVGGADATRFQLGGGSWSGNDTAWRMTLDINKALFYYDRDRRRVTTDPWPDLKYLTIVDALVAGEGAGPLSPSPVAAGCMMSANNPVALDTAAAALMGFDPARLRMVAGGYRMEGLPLVAFPPEAVEICCEEATYSVASLPEGRILGRFEPWVGFQGEIEKHLNQEPGPSGPGRRLGP